jgi:hypothetical protein
MVTIYLPRIKPENYQAFRAILTNDIPEAFEKWERMIANKADEHRLKWQPDCNIVDVEINPEEFTVYCRRVWSKRKLETLFRLATEKGPGESN